MPIFTLRIPSPPDWNPALLTRLAGPGWERLLASPESFWTRFSGFLRLCRVEAGDQGEVLALWLERIVQREVDEALARSPSEGFGLDRLAAALVMSAVGREEPELVRRGCAPTPLAAGSWIERLSSSGAPLDDAGRPLVRYMVLTQTPLPPCAACPLGANCPGPENSR